MTRVEGHPGLAPAARVASAAAAADSGASLFTRYAVDCAAEHRGRPTVILQAGCATAGPELDLAVLRDAGDDVVLCLADDDSNAVRAVLARRRDLESAALGELRSVPLLPRSLDIVQCSMLLHRIRHAELVLDRLVGALRPGGLLLLRTADRETAAAFLDRHLPGALRSVAWRAASRGQPGPFLPSTSQLPPLAASRRSCPGTAWSSRTGRHATWPATRAARRSCWPLASSSAGCPAAA